MVAVRQWAKWLTVDHPDDDAYGSHSPFGRLVDVAGQVLLLGAPRDTITLLHHAGAPAKRRVTAASAAG